MKTDLSEYRINHYSQNGEDGVIEKLFEIAKVATGYLVEFGAWDGKKFSNTYYHYKRNPAFKMCMMECDSERYSELVNNLGDNPENILLNVMVERRGGNSLNSIFEKHNITDIALLSIDIDGKDLDVFCGLDTDVHKPKFVIIESGEWKDNRAMKKMESIFLDKGYNLVCCTGNFIFAHSSTGIMSVNDIHEAMNRSGHPEINLFKGKINPSDYDLITNLVQSDPSAFKFLAGPQIIAHEA